MSQVPIQRTPVAMGDYARALLGAWRVAMGEVPSKQACGVLWAQYMLETGGTACWCWNLGNVKVTQGQVDAGVPWFDLPGTFEYIGGHRIVLPDGDPGRRFRAYPSLDDAMGEHLAFLHNTRYRTAWPAVEAGDCMGFARALSAAHYFTAPAVDYGNGMLWHFRRWMGSDVFENARDGLEMLQTAETQPALPVVDDFDIVHPAVPLRGDPGNDDEPPDDVA